MTRRIFKVGKMWIVDEHHSCGKFYINRGVFLTLKEAEGKVNG